MSICIISDHIIMPKTKFHYNTQHIDQVKPKYEGGGFSPQSPPPLDPPLGVTHALKVVSLTLQSNGYSFQCVSYSPCGVKSSLH